MPDTRAASSAFSAGMKSSVNVLSRAKRAIERAPRMGRSVPSSASSPAKSFPAGSNRACLDASKKDRARGRSMPHLLSLVRPARVTERFFCCCASATHISHPRERSAPAVRYFLSPPRFGLWPRPPIYRAIPRWQKHGVPLRYRIPPKRGVLSAKKVVLRKRAQTRTR